MEPKTATVGLDVDTADVEAKLRELRDLAQDVDPARRSGWRTSEFWLVLVCIVSVVFLLAIGRLTVDDIDRLWSIFGVAGVYVISRGVVKREKR